MCPGHGVEITQKEKEKHPGPVSVRGRERESETKGRSGHGLTSIVKKPKVTGPSPWTIYKRCNYQQTTINSLCLSLVACLGGINGLPCGLPVPCGLTDQAHADQAHAMPVPRETPWGI